MVVNERGKGRMTGERVSDQIVTRNSLEDQNSKYEGGLKKKC